MNVHNGTHKHPSSPQMAVCWPLGPHKYAGCRFRTEIPQQVKPGRSPAGVGPASSWRHISRISHLVPRSWLHPAPSSCGTALLSNSPPGLKHRQMDQRSRRTHGRVPSDHAAKECLWEIEAVAGGYEEGPWRVLAWSWGPSRSGVNAEFKGKLNSVIME